MITNIELTQSGTDKINDFFATYAKAGVNMQAVMLDVLDVLQERVSMDESLSYELGRQYTISGNPEVLTMAQADISVTEEDDDE